MSVYQPFQKASAVWPAGRETEMNVSCRFTVSIPKTEKPVLLRMTGSTVYRVFVNGTLAAYGPARGPKGFFRVDECLLNAHLNKSDNLVCFEAAGYNCNNYYTLDQSSFFQAEILVDNLVVAWTAAEGGMPCDIVTERVQKVQKYSFQRPFVEVWRLDQACRTAQTEETAGKAQLADCGEKKYLPRRVPFATLEKLPVVAVIGAGTVTEDRTDLSFRPREIVGIGPDQKGYCLDELEICLSDDACRYNFHPESVKKTAISEKDPLIIPANGYKTVQLEQNLTGFIGAVLHTEKPATVLFTFDELYEGGDTNIFHMGCCNVVRVDIQPGDYHFLSMEPYTMQYIKMIGFGADITVSDIHLIEYAAPADTFLSYQTDNPAFRKIWDAAVQTYRQNAVDVYTDCPSRERAGWLCDSFWTARTEYALTGKCTVEKNFLENFLLPDSFECLPKGMFPMCYPSDHYNGNYIPNWAMWLVMELREYLDRSGDKEMVQAFRPKIYALFSFLDGYRNTDGLLEKLDEWVFVEWSKANDLVQDVNFPTNMLYAACKIAAGEMYQDDALIAEGQAMQETIRRLSFNGSFFTDHLVRNADGTLTNPGETTEVCQYYAFYCGTASPDTYPALWETLLHAFGPDRKKNNPYPNVHFANAFIGNYLRLDMMAKYGSLDEVLDNISGYFLAMAEMTGTLWENDSTCASVNHGFASHVIVWLQAAVCKQ